MQLTVNISEDGQKKQYLDFLDDIGEAGDTAPYIARAMAGRLNHKWDSLTVECCCGDREGRLSWEAVKDGRENRPGLNLMKIPEEQRSFDSADVSVHADFDANACRIAIA